MADGSLISIPEFRERLLRGDDGAVSGLAITAKFASAATSQSGQIVPTVLSDQSVDLYGDVILAKGWQYSASTPLIWGHDASLAENMLGRLLNARVEGDKFLGDMHFASAAVNPKAGLVLGLIRAGVVTDVSVGFVPLEWSVSKDPKRRGGLDFTSQKLIELSCVGIGANEQAKVRFRPQSNDEADVARAAANIDAIRLRSATEDEDVARARARARREREARAIYAACEDLL